jgi:predicted 2-oxoglutarate/Fe(II)-dependent dioxygenase YbiX
MIEPVPTICIYEKSFKNPETVYTTIEKLIDSDINFNWTWARTAGATENLQGAYRTNQEFSISTQLSHETIKKLDDNIFNEITQLVGDYATRYDIGSLTDEGYNILKYENGTEYKQHHDCGGIHKDRVVSILVYLNDNYIGGELEFPMFNFKYKPNAGDIILFPSNYTFAHIAHPVTSGTKYAIVSWMRYAT